MRYYVRYQYTTPHDAPPPDDFIGPFYDEENASDHRADHGPITSTIVQLQDPPAAEHLISPEQHITDLKARW